MKHLLDLENFDLDEIVDIESVGELPTIDIMLEDTHMFFLENGVYTHNSGMNAEIVTLESISEAFSKCFIADFIFTISRTHDDKRQNSGRCLVAKNRNGPDGLVFDLFMDPSNVDIKIKGHHDFSKNGQLQNNNFENQKKIIKEQYQNWKSSKQQ